MSFLGHNLDGRSLGHMLGLSMTEDTAAGEWPGMVGIADHLDPLRDDAGVIHGGALLLIADSVAGFTAGLTVLPRWVVSTNLTLCTRRHDVRGPLVARAEVWRVGRTSAVSGCRIVDRGRDDALVADCVLTSAALEPSGGPPEFPRPVRFDIPPLGPGAQRWTEVLDAEPVGPRALTMPLTDELRNPWGILHGGATAGLVDLCAIHAVASANGRPGVADDVVLHFLAPGRVGPVRADAEVLGARPDGHVVAVTLRDAGADPRPSRAGDGSDRREGRVVAYATVIVRPPRLA